MRTNIVLDDELVARALELTGVATKRELIHLALETLVATRERKSLLELKGQLRFADGYGHKRLREDAP